MKLNYKICLAVLIASSLIGSAKDKGNKEKKTVRNAAYIEANVITGTDKCGYLLQLLDGRIIKPQSLPRKFRDNHLKVLVKFEELNTVNDSICHAEKTVTITEIKKFKLSANLRSKY